MTSPLYNASVPVMQQMLHALSDVLKKAEEHATQKNIDPNALLQARLFPDMFPLIRQVQIAADFSKGISSRLAGAEVPSWPDTEGSFADLQALIAKALARRHRLSASVCRLITQASCVQVTGFGRGLALALKRLLAA